MESNQEFRSWDNDMPESKGGLDKTESQDTVAASRKVTETTTEQVNAAHATSLSDSQRCQRSGPFFVNSLRQIQYSHVKTGMLCFQIAENPEVQNDLGFLRSTYSR